MYRHMDGYPSGHGKELGDFLAPITLVDGLNNTQQKTVANGMEGLAAQLVARFKTRIGDIYLFPVKPKPKAQSQPRVWVSRLWELRSSAWR